MVDEILANILPGDHVHYKTYDETCSRCRDKIHEDEVPLLIWQSDPEDNNKANYMYAYCERCSLQLMGMKTDGV